VKKAVYDFLFRDQLVFRFFHLTLLNLISNLSIPLVGIADTIFLGRFTSSEHIAGVALGIVLFEYLYWGLSFLRMGTTGTTAIQTGLGNELAVQLVLLRSIIIALILGITIVILSPWIEQLGFTLQVGDERIKAIGISYFRSRIWDAPFTLMNFVIVGWLLGKGRSDLVLIAMITGNLANILLDYLFLKELGMQADGVGLASALAQVIQFLLSLILVRNVFSNFVEALSFKLVLKKREFLSLLSFNKDIFIRTAFLIVTFSLFRNFSSSIGVSTLTVNSILFQFMLVYAFFIDGSGYAIETLAGDLFGRGKIAEVKKLIRIGLSFSVLIAGSLVLILSIFPVQIVTIISKEANLVHDLIDMLPWVYPVLFLGGFAFVYDGLFLGLVKGKILRNSMILSSILFFLPVAILGLYWKSNPIIWISMSTYMLGRTITLAYSARKILCTT